MFGLGLGVGIRALGWTDSWDCFFESSFVNWASLEICCVLLCAKGAFRWTIMVFEALFRGVITTTLYAFRFVAPIVSRVSVKLAIVTLWWTTYLFM
jgi:hypothetical protein